MTSSLKSWRIEFFGGLRARSGELAIERFQTQKTALLLAYLAFYPHRLHSRESLIDLLWPDAELDAGRNRLSQALVWLRARLEPESDLRGRILVADRQRISLNPEAFSTDVVEFRALLKTVGAPDAGAPLSADQIHALETAVSLYRGDFLDGYYDEWILDGRRSLVTSQIQALSLLARSAEHEGQWEKALDYTRRALALDPIAEDLHRDLMRRLVSAGQLDMAARQYREMERTLEQEYGALPSPASSELFRQIRLSQERLAKEGSSGGENASSRADKLAPSLPVMLTRFFGREEQLDQIRELMLDERARLITLTGAGGAGKTRLAVEAAARLAPDRDAVWLVPLQDLTDGRSILALLMSIMRLPNPGKDDPLELIAGALSGRAALIVFDNAEHLAESVADVIGRLVERLPVLRVWVTSRRRLNLNGEREIAVAPLPVPTLSHNAPADPGELMRVDAIRLFVDRAQAVRPSFTVTPQNSAAVARLCERLEGIPLAIELCAAWAQTLTPAQMLEQLDHRFDLLVSRRSGIVERHRSLRAAIDYGYLLLSEDLQRLFVRLSVFRGGWTLDSAAAVCPEPAEPADAFAMLAGITELRERSFVAAEESADGAEMRYRMLETLREFAMGQRNAADEASLRRRHAEYFLGVAEAARGQIAGPEWPRWLARLEAERDNVQAAVAWSVEAGEGLPAIILGLRLALAMVAAYWSVRGYYAEGTDALKALVARSDGMTESTELSYLVNWAYNSLAQMAVSRGDFSDAETFAQTALSLARSANLRDFQSTALKVLGTVADFRGHPSGRIYLMEALAIARESGDPPLICVSLLTLGNNAMAEHRFDEAWEHYSETLDLSQTHHLKYRASALTNLGLVARYRDDLETAERLFDEALALFRHNSNRSGIAITMLDIGTVRRLMGSYSEARALFGEALRICHELGERVAFSWCVKEIGHLACAEEDLRTGVFLLSASERLRISVGITFHPADPAALNQDILSAREMLPDGEFSSAWEQGSRLSFDQAYEAAMDWLKD